MKLPVNYNELTPHKRREVRREYVKVQEGLCYHCKAPLDGEPSAAVKKKNIHPHLYPKGFFNNPIHLHHHHHTEMTLGAVHCYCNAVLWEYHGE